MIDAAAITARFEALSPFLDERERRLLAASEARAAGRGGVAAVSRATGIARSTIGRGLVDLRAGTVRLGDRVRRAEGGGKPAIETQPGLLEALSTLVQSAIRGDPEAALLWVSKSQRHLSAALAALAALGFTAGQKLVGRLLRRLGFSLQANSKTRSGSLAISVTIRVSAPHDWSLLLQIAVFRHLLLIAALIGEPCVERHVCHYPLACSRHQLADHQRTLVGSGCRRCWSFY
jgi:Rhodopirellula transposase DDE domain